VALYPQWVYSATDPPTLVFGPADVAALPSGYGSTPVVEVTPLAAPLPVVVDPITNAMLQIVSADGIPDSAQAAVGVDLANGGGS
jgi:hypothetical protein